MKYDFEYIMRFEKLFKQKIRGYIRDEIYREDILQDFYIKIFLNQDKIPQISEEDVIKWCSTVLINWIRTRMSTNVVKNSYRPTSELLKIKTNEVTEENELTTNYEIHSYSNLEYDLDDFSFETMESFFFMTVPDAVWLEYSKLDSNSKSLILERFVQQKKMKDIAKEQGMTVQDIKNFIFKFRVSILNSLDPQVSKDRRSLTKHTFNI